MSPPPKKQKKYFNKKGGLVVGQRGFLATCNFRESDCIRECYNLLNEYANELYGAEDELPKDIPLDSEETFTDIADDLQKEIEAAKKLTCGNNIKKRRFQYLDTGSNNCLFIRTTLVDPVELCKHIMDDISHKGTQKSRYLMRLVPVQVVCRAYLKDILEASEKLFDDCFSNANSSYSIVYNKRYNDNLNRDELIKELAALVHEKYPKLRVDLKNADKSVVVEVIKGLCCISIVPQYLLLKKYNLMEISKQTIEEEVRENDAPKKVVSEEVKIDASNIIEKNETTNKVQKSENISPQDNELNNEKNIKNNGKQDEEEAEKDDKAGL